MKRCSQCGRTYAEESLAFCPDDGSLLSAPYDPNATLRMSPPTNPTATEVLPSASVSEAVKPGNKSMVLYVAIALGALIVGGLVVGWMMSGDGKPSANSNEAALTRETADTITPRPAATVRVIDISGDWKDQYNIVSHITQQGSQFEIMATGKACGGDFVTNGTGTISGNTYVLNYHTNYSSGRCDGTVSADGMAITSNCDDKKCGAFQTYSRRQ